MGGTPMPPRQFIRETDCQAVLLMPGQAMVI
jgi:hypothetical protein